MAKSKTTHPLIAFRQERGLSQKALAQKLAVAELTVWRWEHGERTPRKADAYRIAKLTGIPAGDLMAWQR